MIADYLVVGGVEVISSPRAAAYGELVDECGTAIGACGTCTPEAGEWLNMDSPYTGVRSDPAPWWDPAIPESGSVTGIYGLDITGTTERIADADSRQITVNFVVNIVDECALPYIQGWLSNVFSPPLCSEGCTGHEICMLACCPSIDDDGELDGPNPLRYAHDIRVVDGPTLVQRSYGTRFWARFEVTLETPNPYFFTEPTPERIVNIRPSDGNIMSIDLPEIYESCVDDTDCLALVDCPVPSFEPLPIEPYPACYPIEPFDAHQTIVSVPSAVMPSGLDVIPVIRIKSGNLRMKNVVIRFYTNPLDVSCIRLPALNPCRACTDLTMSEIPPQSTVVLDGRTGLNTITCTNSIGREVSNPATVYGPPIDGAGAGYVEAISCGPGLCIEVYVAAGAAVGSEITVELWTRANGS